MVAAAFAAVAQPAYAAPPANDSPSGATLIDALPFSDTVTIDEATTEALDATLNAGCGAPATEGSVWYRFVATGTGPSCSTCRSPASPRARSSRWAIPLRGIS
jgi:hypothetical protein